MQTLILHLSDCHFSVKNKLSEAQIRAIAAGAFSLMATPSQVLIVISGDVGAAGKTADYEVANEFLLKLVEQLQQLVPRDKISVVTVPGNHDVDDDKLREAGDILANEIFQNSREPSDARSTYEILLSAQDAYWDFDTKWSSQSAKTVEEKLVRKLVLGDEEQKITLFLVNTAFLSRRHETQGKLWFPISAAKEVVPANGASAGLSIAIFHHPYVWLESNNSTKFRELIEAGSDTAFNGHQHSPESYFVTSLSSTQTWYSGGAALIGKNSSDSGFAALALDSSANTRRLVSYKWNGNVYLPQTDTKEQPVESLTTRRGIALTDDFAAYLDDPESLIVHSQKRNVLLQDIYEPPRLRGGESKANKPSRTVVGSNIAEILAANGAVYVFGDTLSGKTCLAKDAFRQLFKRDGSSIPILLSGRNLESAKAHEIDRWCSRAVRRQFRGLSAPEFQALDREKKIAIVDDWHTVGLNQEARRAVMKHLCARHKHTLLLCDSWYQAQELATVLESTDPLLPKNHFVILQLTAKQRNNIIGRWFMLGRPDDIDASEVVFQTDAAERYLDELYRSRIMPNYPLYVLTALQAMQAVQQSEPDLGAQGVLFDILVGNKLTAMSADAPELDINRQFIALLAHDIFSREGTGVSLDHANLLSKEFEERLAVSLKLEPLLNTLVQHKVLHISDGHISFRHRYMYYYFVAEHMASALAKRTTSAASLDQLKRMTAFLAYEEYAQIIMFVIYKTRNEELIEELIAQSKKIFAGIDPSDLQSDIAFANRLESERRELALAESSVEQNRSARAEELADAHGEADYQAPEIGLERRVEYAEDLDWGAKLQYAFKTTQTLGRVLRNFPGTLDAAQKKELAVNAYGSCLRMLRSILGETEREKADAQSRIREAVDGTGPLTRTERLQIADAKLLELIILCGYGIVRFLSNSVGSPKLKVTIDELRQEMPDVPSIQLIDMAIRLDNFKDIPYERLDELRLSLEKNMVASQVLRMLVWYRLTYFPLEDKSMRGKLCKDFEIKMSSTPILIANSFPQKS